MHVSQLNEGEPAHCSSCQCATQSSPWWSWLETRSPMKV